MNDTEKPLPFTAGEAELLYKRSRGRPGLLKCVIPFCKGHVRADDTTPVGAEVRFQFECRTCHRTGGYYVPNVTPPDGTR